MTFGFFRTVSEFPSAGTLEHFHEALVDAHADAALAASLFHFRELSVGEVKDYLRQHDVPVRPLEDIPLD